MVCLEFFNMATDQITAGLKKKGTWHLESSKENVLVVQPGDNECLTLAGSRPRESETGASYNWFTDPRQHPSCVDVIADLIYMEMICNEKWNPNLKIITL